MIFDITVLDQVFNLKYRFVLTMSVVLIQNIAMVKFSGNTRLAVVKLYSSRANR
jgi:hypothetical protein